MKVKVKNSSSIKTRNKIKLAFATLLNEKQELNKVTVTDIVKEADITRASFYTHFDNVYDIAKELQNETLDILFNNITETPNLDTINNYFDEIINYLKNNEDIYQKILSCDDPLIYIEKLSLQITEAIMEALKDRDDLVKDDLDIDITFFINGCMAIIIKYFKGKTNYTLDDINDFMHRSFKKIFINI